jgi:hypothetical protein
MLLSIIFCLGLLCLHRHMYYEALWGTHSQLGLCSYEVVEKSPRQQFEGNTTTSAVITLWELLTKCHTVTFITNSSDELPWLLPTDFISSWHQLLTMGVGKYMITSPESLQIIVQNLCFEFLLHFQKQWEDWVMKLTCTRETKIIQESQKYSHSSCKKLARVRF